MIADLDIEQHDALLAYLRRSGQIALTEQPVIRTLGGGVSNRTVLLTRPSGEAWVLKQALKKLRVAVEWFSSPERIHREALGMQWLAQLAPPGATTRLIFEDHNYHVLAMEAVPQPHENWKTMLLDGRLDMGHIDQFGQLLGTIHRAAYAQRAQIAAAFDDRSFFETLRIEPYYIYTWTQIPETAHFYDALIADTRARRLTLVHGDYSPKNILVYNGRADLARPRGDSLWRPSLRSGLRADALAEQGAPHPHDARGLRRRSRALLANLSYGAWRCAVGGRPGATRGCATRSAACLRAWPGARRWSICVPMNVYASVAL